VQPETMIITVTFKCFSAEASGMLSWIQNGPCKTYLSLISELPHPSDATFDSL